MKHALSYLRGLSDEQLSADADVQELLGVIRDMGVSGSDRQLLVAVLESELDTIEVFECLECQTKFIPLNRKRKLCSERCAAIRKRRSSAASNRRRRAIRRELGQCVQCGVRRDVDNPDCSYHSRRRNRPYRKNGSSVACIRCDRQTRAPKRGFCPNCYYSLRQRYYRRVEEERPDLLLEQAVSMLHQIEADDK